MIVSRFIRHVSESGLGLIQHRGGGRVMVETKVANGERGCDCKSGRPHALLILLNMQDARV